MFGNFLGKKIRDPQSPGVPRGQVMEARAILLVALLILAGLGAWWGIQQMDKQVYLGGATPERISTAAGTQHQP